MLAFQFKHSSATYGAIFHWTLCRFQTTASKGLLSDPLSRSWWSHIAKSDVFSQCRDLWSCMSSQLLCLDKLWLERIIKKKMDDHPNAQFHPSFRASQSENQFQRLRSSQQEWKISHRCLMFRWLNSTAKRIVTLPIQERKISLELLIRYVAHLHRSLLLTPRECSVECLNPSQVLALHLFRDQAPKEE